MTKQKRAPNKPSRKPVSPSGMNEYCFKVTGKIDRDTILKHLERKVYRSPKFEDSFKSSEDLPFSFLFPKSGNIVCIKMNSRAKKNLERVEEIHRRLTSKDLSFDGITLSKPELFELEQCNWWEGECKFGEIQQWKTLSHNGPYFKDLEPYKAHRAPLVYAGKKYELSPQEEKAANYYAQRIVSERSPNITVYWTKDKTFNENFWADFTKYLTPEHKKIFADWKRADFGLIADKLEEIKANKTKQDAKDQKEKNAEIKHDYGYATINGITEPLGNYVVEPASLFLGRGDNPKRGKIKREVMPEDVTINIGKEAKVPAPPKGHKWGEIIHNQEVSWVAAWKDTITGEPKYVRFAAEGQLKGKSDFMKYEKARKLNKFIEEVRAEYTKDIDSGDLTKRQLGTVIYLIDHFGLRAGGEKSEDETDTVGASTLRVEQVKLKPPNKVIFDFLGKDSIRYYKELEVTKDIYRNIGEFLKGKNEGADLFNKISAADINNYLKSFDKSFTAKVFRTRLASVLMYEELKKIKLRKGETEADKKLKFDRANVAVAEVLNHQRTVSKKNKEAIAILRTKLEDLKKELAQKRGEGKNTDAIQKRIDGTARSIQSKSDTLNVAMSTSRTNYIDPRIVVAWCEKNGLDISKVYSAPNQKKFKWAVDTTGPDWDYFTAPLPEGMDRLNPVEIVSPSKARADRSPRRKSVGKKPVPRSYKSPPAPGKAPSKKTPSAAPSPSARRAKAPPAASPLALHEFSKTAFAAVGGSAEQHKILRNLGGVFNPNVLVGAGRVPGFVFKKGREEEVKEAAGYVPPKKLEEEPLVAFYLNQKRSHGGYMFGEIMKWDKLELERNHDYIQTLFPLPSRSKYAPGAPVLTGASLEEFRTNGAVRANVVRAYFKMMNFFGYSVDVSKRRVSRVSPLDLEIGGEKVGLMSSHNYLRITRMLTFLRLAKFSLLAWIFFLGLCRDLKGDEKFRDAVLKMGSLGPWMLALGMSEEAVKNYDAEKLAG